MDNNAINTGKPLPCTLCQTGYHKGADVFDVPMCVPNACPHYWNNTFGKCECPGSQTWNGSACVDNTPPPKCEVTGSTNYGGSLPCQCPEGAIIQNNDCVCPANTDWNGSKCVPKQCPSGTLGTYPDCHLIPKGPCAECDMVNGGRICGSDRYSQPLPMPRQVCYKDFDDNTPPPPPSPFCNNPWASNYGQNERCDEPCSYDKPAPDCQGLPAAGAWSCPANGEWHYIAKCQN